jgi:diguanylate cyclase (GGDEF)-like protein/PAS domain S-box-containing protein
MLKYLAVNFPEKALKLLQGKIRKSGKRDISVVSPEAAAGKEPDAILLYWGKGAKDYIKSNPPHKMSIIAVFPKETKAAIKDALALGVCGHLSSAELSAAGLARAAARARAASSRPGGAMKVDGMFEVFMKYSPAVAFIKDKEGRYCYVNTQWEKLSGRSFEAVNGKTNEQLWSKETAERMNRDDLEILQKGTSKEVGEWIPMKGERLFFITRKFPILDDMGKPCMVAGMSVDVTEIEKARQAREIMERKYKHLIDTSNDGMVVVDPQTMNILEVNRVFAERLGYTAQELLRMRMTDINRVTDPAEDPVYQALREGKHGVFERILIRKDGSTFPVEISARILELEGKEVMAGFVRDVTNRIKAENEIKRGTELTRLLKDIAVESNEAAAAETALMTAIDKIREFTGWDLGHVYIVGPDGNIRSSGLISCSDPALMEKFRRMTEAFVFGPGEGLPGKVCQSGKPTWFLDVSRQDVCARDRAMAHMGLNAAFAFPVMEGKKAAAALEFFARSMDEPDALMLEAINSLAVQLGRVTERKKISEKLQLAQRIIESAKEGILITDSDGTIESVNRAFTELTGYPPEEAIGNNPRLLKSGKNDDEFYRRMWDSLLTKGNWEGEIWNRRKDGSAYPELLSITAIKDDSGATVKYAAIFNDISEFVSSKKEIEYQAYHDALTGLPNRLLLLDRLKQALARAHRNNTQFAILFMDLDNFKHINDSLGHVTGDMILKGTAIRLVGCLREGDTVSRFGGDEFCALVENIKDEYEVMEVARRILDSLAEPYLFGSEELVSTVSIGASIFPADSRTADGLMKNADMAMYHAKEAGKSNFQFFRVSMNEQYAKRLELESGLRRAIEKKSMEPHYQPKVNLATGHIVGMEALVRWKQADGSLISSYDFIRIAEETGLVYELDRWMMASAMKFTAGLNKRLMARGLPAQSVSVNLSARDLERAEIVEVILGSAREADINPAKVDLEITESAIIKSLDKTVSILHRLREEGFNIALDDFGVGYSSMNYIRRLPINIVKMDRSFIMDLEPDHDSRLVAQSIISLAHGLGKKVVAEGVETEYQLGFLREAKCDEMQGWLFSKAVSAEEFEKLIDAGARLKL